MQFGFLVKIASICSAVGNVNKPSTISSPTKIGSILKTFRALNKLWCEFLLTIMLLPKPLTAYANAKMLKLVPPERILHFSICKIFARSFSALKTTSSSFSKLTSVTSKQASLNKAQNPSSALCPGI